MPEDASWTWRSDLDETRLVSKAVAMDIMVVGPADGVNAMPPGRGWSFPT